MRRLAIVVFAVVFAAAGAASAQVTKNYGGATMNASDLLSGHFNDVWDLTCGDLVLSYTIDLSNVTQTRAYETSFTEVGLRQVGAPDFNPGPWNTYQGGAGGWMASLVGDLATNPNLLDDDDKHNLQVSGGRGEGDYDATDPFTVVPSFGTTANYGIWFDRDGVDPDQATQWDMTDGAIYNTNGLYKIAISYHAIDAGLGTMFATVNGIQTGFYTDGWKNAEPDIYPAGLSFKGDMSQMQVFYGTYWTEGAGGSVALSDITVTGCPAIPEPVFFQFGALMGLGGLGVLKLRRR